MRFVLPETVLAASWRRSLIGVLVGCSLEALKSLGLSAHGNRSKPREARAGVTPGQLLCKGALALKGAAFPRMSAMVPVRLNAL